VKGNNGIIAVAATILLGIALSGCGGGPRSNTGNQPPAITAAAIIPDQPLANSTLAVNAEVNDPEGDPVTLSTEWFVNGRLVASEEGSQFSTAGLRPGDRIKARVTAADSSGRGEPFATGEVTLQENLSGIDSVVLSPSPVRTGTTVLTARPFLAPGASPNLKLTYHWTVAGKALDTDGPSISLSGLKSGDRIMVEAMALAGTQRGNPFRVSATVTNDAPVITGIALSSQDSTGYRYQVSATDPDNDPVSFQLVSGPPGTAIGSAGLLFVPMSGAGQTVRIRASDNSGNWIERELETSK
jgi:hypothetical protein